MVAEVNLSTPFPGFLIRSLGPLLRLECFQLPFRDSGADTDYVLHSVSIFQLPFRDSYPEAYARVSRAITFNSLSGIRRRCHRGGGLSSFQLPFRDSLLLPAGIRSGAFPFNSLSGILRSHQPSRGHSLLSTPFPGFRATTCAWIGTSPLPFNSLSGIQRSISMMV